MRFHEFSVASRDSSNDSSIQMTTSAAAMKEKVADRNSSSAIQSTSDMLNRHYQQPVQGRNKRLVKINKTTVRGFD